MRWKDMTAVVLVAVMPMLSGCMGLLAAEVGAMAVSGAIGDPTANLGHRSLNWAPTPGTLQQAYERILAGAPRTHFPIVAATAGGSAGSPMAATGLDLPNWIIRYEPRTVINTANTVLLSSKVTSGGRCTVPVEARVTLSGLHWDLVSQQVQPGYVRRWIPVAQVTLDVVARADGKPMLHKHYENRASGAVHKERARLKAVLPVLDDALAGAYVKALHGIEQARESEVEKCVSG